jgi:sedoheptulose-bisphosphatase
MIRAKVLSQHFLNNNTSSSDSNVLTLSSYLPRINASDTSLNSLLSVLSQITLEISLCFSLHSVENNHSTNQFGDKQLNVDLLSEDIIVKHLLSSKLVDLISSEENVKETALTSECCSNNFLVSYDPLDGSSIIDCNYAVGSIFAIFPSSSSSTNHDNSKPTFLNQTGNNVLASVISVYGPRTTLIIALARLNLAFEATYNQQLNDWIVTTKQLHIADTARTFAPANLRACVSNPLYKSLVDYYTMNGYTLRYSGGLVPDINHILIKGEGIFLSPYTKQAKAKLRLLYECYSIACIIQCSGGAAVDSETGLSLLDIPLNTLDQRVGIVAGSKEEVNRYIEVVLKGKC